MKKFLQIALSLFFSLNINAQVGYHIQLPIGNGSSFYLLNSDSIYLSNGVTGKSNMMHINPNTKAWEYLNTPYLPNYGAPVIRDKNNGLILTPGSNSIQVTSDGWQTVTTSTASYLYINKSLAGYYGYKTIGSSSTLVYSTNGLNWSNATMPGFMTIMAVRNYGNKVVALSASQSFSNMISFDGGLTYTGAANTSTFTGTFVDFHMLSVDTFLVFMNNTLCKSFNGGVTWTNTPLPTTINSVAVKNKNEFAFTASSGSDTFTYTTNGGATWQASVNQMPVWGVGQLFYHNNYYYLFPWYRTNDYGVTWENFLPNMGGRAFGIDFNGNKGLLGLLGGKYAYSLDKGRSFTNYTNTIGSNQDIMATKVLTNGNFLAGDRKGQIYTSNDNGQTWINKNVETLSPNSIRFLTSANENTVVLTRAGLPVVSVDGSATYSVVVYSTSGGTHLQALKPNGQMLDIRDINGWEMRTFDITGATTVIATNTLSGSESLGAFYMTSNTDGYILTRDNTAKINNVYKTTDGGLTFTKKTSIAQVVSGSSAYMNTPFVSGTPLFHHFGNDTIIVAANYNNFYHISYDGAVTWNTITPDFVPGNATYGNTIYRMNYFTHNSYLAITGDAFGPLGLYINTAGVAGPTIGIKELNFDKGKENLVVFPNPSTQDNLISLLNLEEEAQVSIYNVNGQLEKSIVTFNGTFNTENLNAGLYIVQVQQKNKPLRTAKLVIQ